MSLHSSVVLTSFGRVSMYNVYRLYSLPLENVSTMNCSRASLADDGDGDNDDDDDDDDDDNNDDYSDDDAGFV